MLNKNRVGTVNFFSGLKPINLSVMGTYLHQIVKQNGFLTIHSSCFGLGKNAKFALNITFFFPLHYLHHCRELVQLRCHKGAGTKMHKCLVGSGVNLIVLVYS